MKKYNTAERLRQIMTQRNLRQVDIVNLCKPIGEKMGVRIQKSDISQYLSGNFEPKQSKLYIMARALGVTEPWLMGYEEDEPELEGLDSLDPERRVAIELVLSAPSEAVPRIRKLIEALLE